MSFPGSLRQATDLDYLFGHNSGHHYRLRFPRSQNCGDSGNRSRIDYTYDPATLAPDKETIAYDLDADGTADFTRVLDRKALDTLGRDQGWELKNDANIETQVSYGYSATDGRLTTVADSASTFTYDYTPNSNLLATVTGPAHSVTYTWETDRDVLSSKINKVGATAISSYTYGVNNLGQRTDVTTGGTAFPALPTWIWGYDSLGQVTKAESSVTGFDRAYQYDGIGNREKSADSLTLPATNNYTVNALNQYTAIQQGGTGASPVHDDDGNATAYPLPTVPTANSILVWDAEHRLIETQVASSGPLVTTLYDAQSRRIAETIGNTTTLYIYDGWNCVAEYTGGALTLTKTRLWGIDLSGSMQGAGGVGGMLAETHHTGTAAAFYPTYDGNGNVSEYLDSSGQTIAHFEYDPFGRLLDTMPLASEDLAIKQVLSYRFSTKPINSATGLYYYGYRWYDPQTGRWPCKDPIEEEGGINLYAFLENDGTNKIDKLGLKKYKVSGVITFPSGPGPDAYQNNRLEYEIEYEVTCENGEPRFKGLKAVKSNLVNSPDRWGVAFGVGVEVSFKVRPDTDNITEKCPDSDDGAVDNSRKLNAKIIAIGEETGSVSAGFRFMFGATLPIFDSAPTEVGKKSHEAVHGCCCSKNGDPE